MFFFFFFQAEDGIRDHCVTGVQTCALPIYRQAHFNLGRILVNQKKYLEGIQELEKTIEPEDENSPRYVYALGAAFARSGDRQNALRYIRQARDGAAARGQSALLTSIERDLRALEAPGTPQ